jgi:DNA-binding transcriptional MerR regulator
MSRSEANGSTGIRIGELSRRVGVRPETLRAWERRYRVLEPGRSDGNFRLYSSADEARVRAMIRLLDRGLAPAEAAKLARDTSGAAERTGMGAPEVGAAAPEVERARERLLEALLRFDEPAAGAILDSAFARFSTDDLLSGLALPLMAEVGERWHAGEIGIAEEHFCTAFVRARLLALARGWGVEEGPRALLACPPGEHHDIGLVAFGIALAQTGWRITYLGADTPVAALAAAAKRLDADLLVVAGIEPQRLERVRTELRRLAEHYALAIGGAAATPLIAEATGAAYLGGDPVSAARTLVPGGA